MPKFAATLAGREEVAHGTMCFRFDLGGQPFSFKPGQAVRMRLGEIPHPDDKGNARTFSIASAPGEPLLMVAMRMTDSAFKRSLAEIPLGSKVDMAGPSGSFVIGEDSDESVALFGGGIGITPFRSMIQHACTQGWRRPITLVYSNRRPEDAAFLDELLALEKQNPRFRLLATMTQPEQSGRPWPGPTARVDVAFVREYFPGPAVGRWYLAGPPRFVASVSEALVQAGIPSDRLEMDEFEGY